MALTDNLKAYYKLDESSGNAADATGNGYTLTNNGTTPFANGKINNGADFGNVDSRSFLYSSVSPFGISSTGAVSVSLWFKFVSEPATDDEIFYLFFKSATGSYIRCFYYYNAGTPQLSIGRGGSTGAFTFYNINLGDNTWKHFVMTYDGTNLLGYLNGAQVLSTTSTGTYDNSAAPQGGFNLAGTGLGIHGMNGMQDEIGVWSRAITAQEVQVLYRGGLGLAYPFGTSFKQSMTRPALFKPGNSK